LLILSSTNNKIERNLLYNYLQSNTTTYASSITAGLLLLVTCNRCFNSKDLFVLLLQSKTNIFALELQEDISYI